MLFTVLFCYAVMGSSESTLKGNLLPPPVKNDKPRPIQSPGLMEFEPAQSYCLSVGIDTQTDPVFKDKSLTAIAGRDATHISVLAQKKCEHVVCVSLCVYCYMNIT